MGVTVNKKENLSKVISPLSLMDVSNLPLLAYTTDHFWIVSWFQWNCAIILKLTIQSVKKGTGFLRHGCDAVFKK